MKKETKKKRKLKKGLIKKFILLIIMLIIGISCIIGAIYFVNINKDEIIQVFTRYDYKVYKTTSDKVEVLNDNYIIEKDKDGVIEKITEFNNTVLYQNNNDKNNYTIIEGIDNQLYMYSVDKSIDLYCINKEKRLINTIDNNKKNTVPIIYIDSNNHEILLGFYGNNSIYTLDKKQYTINGYELIGNKDKSKIITLNKNEIIIVKNNKYGIYDIKDNVTLIEPKYDKINNYDDTYYIAFKGKEAGIINSKDKVVLDFDYDNIKKNIVIKNEKIALLNNNFEIITKYEFKDNNNSYVLPIDRKYLLVTEGVSYLINNNGSYTSIKENIIVCDNNNDFYYSYNSKEKEFVIYDENIEKKYSIFVDNYDINTDTIYKFGNTIMINDTYYNYDTGEILDKINKNILELSNVNIKYEKNNINVFINDKIIYNYEYDFKNNRGKYMSVINNNLNNGFYIINDDEVLVVRKK